MILAGAVAALAIAARADTITHPNASGGGSTTINMDFVNVGNPGNTADVTGYGAVGYNYRIGTYAVTADQWAAVRAAAPAVGNAGIWTGSQPTAGATYGTAYFIPSESEWYKAAYYKGSTSTYYNYPTGSDSVPTAVYGGTAAGTAVFYAPPVIPTSPANVNNAGGLSPYGTMGQGGNVWEWNEALIGSSRGMRGGGWGSDSGNLASSGRASYNPASELGDIGFRVASVPEPGSLVMLAGIALTALLYWRRKRCVKCVVSVVAVLCVVCLGSVELAKGSVVKWQIEDGGNGHFYEAVDAGAPITWQNARAAAESRGGYLATITT